MLLSTLVGYWLGLALGFSLAKIGLTALSMVYVARQSTRLPWVLEKLVLWGHSIVKKLFTVFRLPLYAFGAYIRLCVLVRVWSEDRLFRIDGMPQDCASAPSPVHGCHRLQIVIVPDATALQRGGGVGGAVFANNAMTTGAGSTRRLKQETPDSGAVHRARKAPRKQKKQVHEIVSSLDECLTVDGVAKMIDAWADDDATFVRRLWRTVDTDGSVSARWRVLSTVFGFADDLLVRVGPSGAAGGKAINVDAQSQLRLGIGDLGVNKRRILRLVERLRLNCAA